MTYPTGETITVTSRTAAGEDAYGNQTYTTTSRTIDRVPVAQRTSSDLTENGRDGQSVGLTIYPPHDSGIVASDVIGVYGEDYRIVGDPGAWRSPWSGWAPGLAIDLERAEG